MKQTIGGHAILGTLGRGGMGVVYRARDAELGRDVALKVRRDDRFLTQEGEEARARFAKEIEATARLAHPSVAAVYRFGEDEGVPWFTQELIEGASLEEVLEHVPGRSPEILIADDLRSALEEAIGKGETQRPWNQEFFSGSWVEVSLRIARQIADALQHAHERGVLHRDVKPSNVLVTPEGRVVLVDFGVAQMAEGGSQTESGEVVGSLLYAAPEVADGRSEAVDARSDVYSLGAVLYELLALVPPFRGPSPGETRWRVLEGEAPPLGRCNPAVPADVATICHHALDRWPARRYSTAAGFGADLGNVLARRPITAKPPGPLGRTVRWVQRRPGAAAALAVTFLALFVAPSSLAALRAVEAAELDEVRGGLEATLAERRRHLDLVSDALAFAGDRLADPSFDGVTRIEDARRKTAERAVRVLEELLKSQPDDELLQAELERFRSMGRGER